MLRRYLSNERMSAQVEVGPWSSNSTPLTTLEQQKSPSKALTLQFPPSGGGRSWSRPQGQLPRPRHISGQRGPWPSPASWSTCRPSCCSGLSWCHELLGAAGGRDPALSAHPLEALLQARGPGRPLRPSDGCPLEGTATPLTDRHPDVSSQSRGSVRCAAPHSELGGAPVSAGAGRGGQGRAGQAARLGAGLMSVITKAGRLRRLEMACRETGWRFGHEPPRFQKENARQ